MEQQQQEDDPEIVSLFGFRSDKTEPSRFQNLPDKYIPYERSKIINKKKAVLLVTPAIGGSYESIQVDIQKALSKLQDKHGNIMLLRFTNPFDDILRFSGDKFPEFIPGFSDYKDQKIDLTNRRGANDMFVYTDYEIIGGIKISSIKMFAYHAILTIRVFLEGKWVRNNFFKMQRHMYEEKDVVGVFKLTLSLKELQNYMSAKPLGQLVLDKENIPPSAEAKVDIKSLRVIGRFNDSDYKEREAYFIKDLTS